MKKIWMLLTGALLSVCLWMGIGTPLEARAQDVTLERGEEVYYEKYSTFYYYIDGELGYCLEPEKNSPHGGLFRRIFWTMIPCLRRRCTMCTEALVMRTI